MTASPAPDTRHALQQTLPGDVRAAARSGELSSATHGFARGFVQANLAILPESHAFDFLRFCVRNPKPCPLIDITDPGRAEPRRAAPGADLRTDLPAYRVYRDGQLVDEVRSIENLWRDDHVAFLLGCSNSFDEILLRNGIPQRHLESAGGRISVYESNIQCEPAGIFRGPVAVTMRPIPAKDVVRTVELSSRYPIAHGAPLHIGDPAEIGIADLAQVKWGKFNPPSPDDVPVYWACGVTPQAVALAAGIPEMITHAPGHMFVTDWRIDDQRKG
ncbi:putative hydro-lyase [Pelagibius litoralis]|uniref:Hydro-lyase n=1 Tax=Pelagibius litoralis TaxID=374515 RepID=A0A967C444_9PROT|nr:putative hydro-lyase [Pelagibius litoralis]NIA68199.1 putative hydro-lyase [Pelagibius litoralis]